jgi:hypothetical protein
MTSTNVGERERLVIELEQARKKLLASIQGLTTEQMTQAEAVGEWTVKDVLSHVTSWEEFALPDLHRLARGDAPALASIGNLESTNYDGPNSIIMALRRNLPLDQVLRELHLIHADFVEAVNRLPESALVEGQFGRGLVQITAAHDNEHADHILAWRTKEGLSSA